MDYFDTVVLTYVNKFAMQSRLFDAIMEFLTSNQLFKGGVLAVLIWWVWFERDDRYALHREHIIVTLVGSLAAVALSQALGHITPFHVRPVSNIGLNFTLLHGMERPPIPDSATSFPSDHATLFFSLATGLFFISRRVGIFALLYTGMCIIFPRMYTGLHNPSDIIVGALVGIAVAAAANKYLVRHAYTALITRLSYSKPQYFYPVFFIIIYQIVDLFSNTRMVLSVVAQFLRSIIA